jgi:tetratricopeptide (TPR) repeat protein
MQSAAAPGTILVSADTHRLTRHAFDFQPRGPLEVKGKAAPIEAWQVVGLKAAPASARGLAGLRAPLVGRAAESERLHARLAGLAPGQPGAWVALMGEAGLGKSRLAAELRQSHDPAALMWLEGRCVSFGRYTSHLPWRQIIRQSLGAPADAPAEVVRARLEYTACECCALPGGDLPFLEAVLAVASEESLKTVLGYTGDELVHRMTEAVRGYLCAQARVRPLVIVLEDLHWADEASLALLENICGLVPEHPLLLLGVMRPDKDAPAWALAQRVRQTLAPAYVEEIPIEPLSPEHSRDLLGLLLHIEDLPARVRSLILEKAEGNPFFVEEVIRSLLDSGHIVREDGYWRATREIETVSIPNTLAGLLSARIDALPDDAKRLAQMSAVIGRSFAFRVIESVCAAAPPAERLPAIEPPLDLLTRQEIVRVAAHDPELEYAFKHVLTQEAAYNSLLLRRRREFHARAGEVLQTLYPDRVDELAPTLAYHFWEAGDWPRAAAHALRAGQAAQRVYALREAMRQYDRAIEALEKDGGTDEDELYAALMGWARAAFKFRPYPEQLDRLKRAEQIARRQGHQRRLAETLHALGDVYVAQGRNMRATPVLAEAFALAEALGDDGLATVPSFHAAFTMMFRDPQASIPMYDRAIELARKHGNRSMEAYSLTAKGMGLAHLGRAEESLAALTAGLELVRSLNAPVAESDAELFAGWAYLDLGDPQSGLAHGQRGVELAIATDNFDCICGGLACVGFAHLNAQQLPEATTAFHDAIEQTKTSGALTFEVLASAGLAIAQLAGGQPGALPELEQALARARALDNPYIVATLSQAVAEERLAQGDLDGARAYLEPAIEHFRATHMQPYLERALATQSAIEAAR